MSVLDSRIEAKTTRRREAVRCVPRDKNVSAPIVRSNICSNRPLSDEFYVDVQRPRTDRGIYERSTSVHRKVIRGLLRRKVGYEQHPLFWQANVQ